MHSWQREVSRKIVEKIFGKPLPRESEIHHVDGNPTNTKNNNLVLCQNSDYHNLLHVRQKAVDAGFPAYYKHCFICKRFDDPAILKKHQSKYFHRECINFLRRRERSRKACGLDVSPSVLGFDSSKSDYPRTKGIESVAFREFLTGL